jgi:flagellar biosynthesis protein
VTALGKGYFAEQMVKEAERSHVQIVEDQSLSHVLHRLSVGDEIPEALYQVVAEILVFVYQADRQAGSGHDAPGMK